MKTYCISQNTHKNDKINTNSGRLFVCDNLTHYIYILQHVQRKTSKTLIISKCKNVWVNYFKQKQINDSNIFICNTNNINYSNTYERIIYDNIEESINLNSKNNWYICENVDEISILNLKKFQKLYLNIDILHIDETVLYSLSKIIYYKTL